MADGQIKGQEILAEDVFERFKRLDDVLEGILNRFGDIEKKAQRAFSGSQLNQATVQTKVAVDQANIALREQARLEKAVAVQKERNKIATSQTAKELAKQRVETQNINRENRRSATIVSATAGAYRRLSAELSRQKDLLKDIIIEQGEFSDAAIRQRKEVDKLAERVKRADNIAGDFQRNVGNYPSALKPVIGVIRGLVGAFGIVEGLRLGSRIVRETVQVAREAKGVEFAFRNVGTAGVEAFDKIRESTRGLLSDLEIKRAIVEFDNFRLNAADLDTVLEFVSLRAAQTGKSFEYLRDSAIEAITKESVLRADNLGLSQKALNEEIEKGATFLQAFTNIANRELSRAGNILDEATNSATRFDAQMENLKLQIGEIILRIKGFSVINDVMERLVKSATLANQVLGEQNGAYKLLLVNIRNLTPAGRQENDRILEEIKLRKQAESAIQAEIDAMTRLRGVYGPLKEEQENAVSGSGGGFGIFAGINDEAPRLLKDINDELEVQLGLLEEGNFATRKEAKVIQDKITRLEKEKEAILGAAEAQKKRTQAQKEYIENFEQDSEAAFDSAISYLKEERSLVAINSDAYRELTKEIENLQKAKEKLAQGGFRGVLSDLPFLDQDDEDVFFDVENFLNTEGIDQGLKSLAEKLGVTQGELVDEFESLYQKDYNNFIKYQELKLEQEQILKEQRIQNQLDGLDVAGEFAQAFFEIQSNRIDRELERQNEAFDAIVNNKNASEEQIAIAERKRDENEKKLEKERQKRQKRAFLIQQAIEVGKVLIQDAAATAAALAPPPVGLGPVFGATLIPGIKINTGLALAAILAQTIPQFFRGKGVGDNYEGLATWGERQREVKISSDGRVDVSPNRTTPLYVKRDDIILKSIPDFVSKMRDQSSETFKRVSKTFRDDTIRRSSSVLPPGGVSGRGLEEVLKMGLKSGFRGVEHKINIINRIEGRITRYG